MKQQLPLLLLLSFLFLNGGCGSQAEDPLNQREKLSREGTSKAKSDTDNLNPENKVDATSDDALPDHPDHESSQESDPDPMPNPGQTSSPSPMNLIVNFTILPGTGTQPWNTMQDIITLKIGQTLRIKNDDTVPHRLHTNGSPCPHGAEFAAGSTFECVVSKAFEPGNSPLYDHIGGPSAAFWIRAIP